MRETEALLHAQSNKIKNIISKKEFVRIFENFLKIC
jgi:hypothetical protein